MTPRKPETKPHKGTMPDDARRAAIAASLVKHVADPSETNMADCEALRDLLIALTWSSETERVARAAMAPVSECVRQEGF